MRITGSFTVLKLDKDRLTKAVDEKIQVEMRQALRAFLDAAVKRVPVLTGMSRGGFVRLAQYLGRSGVSIPGARPKPSRNPGRGFAQSELDDSGFKYPTYNLNYSIHVFQFNFHDPDNWRATAAGRKALERYIEKNFASKLPKVTDYITRTTVEF